MPVFNYRNKGLHYSALPESLNGEPLLVYVHGAGGDRLQWTSEFMLAYPSISVDLPGHGDSEGPGFDSISHYVHALRALLNDLPCEKFILCGHSMGSAVIQELALDYNKGLEGMILIGAAERLSVSSRLLDLLKEDSSFSEGVDMVVKLSFARDVDDALRSEGRRSFMEAGRDVTHKDFLACDNFDVSSRVPDIHVPTLILAGDRDKMTPPVHAEFLDQHILNSHLEILPGAGHMLHIERKVEVAGMIKDWIAD